MLFIRRHFSRQKFPPSVVSSIFPEDDNLGQGKDHVRGNLEVSSLRKREPLKVSGMTKQDLLEYLAGAGRADAMDVASSFGVTYAAAAMALLRLVRQSLVHRYVDADDGLYFYQLSERGHARLAFFRNH